MTTAIVTDQRFDLHTWHGHVEQASRLHAIQRAIQSAGLLGYLKPLPIRPATEAELLAVHSPHMLHRVRQLASYGGGQIDSDTYVTADLWEVGLLAAGATICLAEAIAEGRCHNGFALVRPPGHHATDTRSMGFCLFNNIAIAAMRCSIGTAANGSRSLTLTSITATAPKTSSTATGGCSLFDPCLAALPRHRRYPRNGRPAHCRRRYAQCAVTVQHRRSGV